MSSRDISAVTLGNCEDIYCLDTGMFDVSEYGSVYIIDDERPAVIDTGTGSNYEQILDAIGSVGISQDDLDAIIQTHVHLDHAGGAGYLIEECPNASVYVYTGGAQHLVSPDRLVHGTKQAVGDLWKYYRDPQPVPEDRIVPLDDQDVIDLGERQLVMHHAPGHAPHHTFLESPSDDAVFAAEAAGIYVQRLNTVLPAAPPPRFDYDAAINDIEHLRKIDPGVLLYGHYGAARTGNLLDEYEKKLTAFYESVKRKLSEFNNKEEVFQHFISEMNNDLSKVWSAEKANADQRLNVAGVIEYIERA